MEVGEAIEEKEMCMIARLYIRCMTGMNQNRITFVYYGLAIVLSMFKVVCQFRRAEICE